MRNPFRHFFVKHRKGEKVESEKNTLVKAGWKYEGIGFYAMC